MPKRLCIEYVRGHFREKGCELLAGEYVNNSTKMPYRCSCGRVAEVTWNSFRQQDARCPDCEIAKRRQTRQKNKVLGRHKGRCDPSQAMVDKRAAQFERIRKCFSEQGCELLEAECISLSNFLRYRCKCGTEGKVKWNVFKRGGRCDNCAVNQRRSSIDDVRQYFLSQECELLDQVYVNSVTPVKYRCSCGNVSRVAFGDFKRGVRCWSCRGVRSSPEMKKNHWSKSGVYSPPKKRVEKVCLECGGKYEVVISLKNTTKFCSLKCKGTWSGRLRPPPSTPESLAKMAATKIANGSVRGEKNPNWKGGITPVNAQIRNCEKYKKWVSSVYRRDHYTCQICLRKPPAIKLEAHHLKQFAAICAEHNVMCLEDGIACQELWDLNNGITYCRDCHKDIDPSYNFKR